MKQLLTQKDLSDLLQVEIGTIRTWVHRGIIPSELIFKLPTCKKGTIRFLSEETYLWIRTGKVLNNDSVQE